MVGEETMPQPNREASRYDPHRNRCWVLQSQNARSRKTVDADRLCNVQEDWQEQNDLASTLPEKLDEMKQLLLKAWDDIKAEGPNDWWEAERSKPVRGGALND